MTEGELSEQWEQPTGNRDGLKVIQSGWSGGWDRVDGGERNLQGLDLDGG